jgi:aminopeptidase N
MNREHEREASRMSPIRRARLAWTAVLILSGWSGAAVAVTLGSADTDAQSYANVDEFRTTHLELVLDVDFHNRELAGEAVLEMKRLDPKSTEIVLDTQGLNVLTVSELSENFYGATEKMAPIWNTVPFRVGKADPIRGSPLFIEISASNEPTVVVKIEYETTPKSTGLHWRVPEGPRPKGHAYLYTASGGIGARSWIPLQDTPQVRMAYKVLVRTTDDSLAVMGAANDPKAKHNGTYAFLMSQEVPSYTLALAVGHIEFRPTGPRTGVYAEKPELKAAAKDFASTEAMLAAAEKILGSYQWQRYDEVVLPAEFSVAAAGFPRLLFASPTLLTDDDSSIAPVADGVGATWAGDLVSPAGWRDRWLSEAFSRYLGQRVAGELWGGSRAAIEAVLDFAAFQARLASCDADDQILASEIQGRDLDAGCSDITAAKGALFLVWLETNFGRERFDAFLRGYFDHFAWEAVSTEQFSAYLASNLLERFPGIVTGPQVDDWLRAPGLPADAVTPTTGALAAVDAARSQWSSGAVAAKKLDTHGWIPRVWVYFLDGLAAPLTPAQLAELDKAFDLSASRNALVLKSWLALAIRNDYQAAFPLLDQYLRAGGRADLVVPLYRDLVKTRTGAAVARRTFALARGGYDPRVARTIEAFVKP